MEEDKLKQLSAMDCRQYYQLGLVMDQDQMDSIPDTPPQHFGPILSDDLSDCGSEDVETVPHRYDPPTRLDDPNLKPGVSYSLADEIRMSLSNNHQQFGNNDVRPPPPDLLLSANCKRIIRPSTEFLSTLTTSENSSSKPSPGLTSISSATSALGDQMDWDMVIGSGGFDDNPVDLVVRNQPEMAKPEVAGYSNSSARRRVVHRVTNLDGFDPTCGNCCLVQ